VKFSDLLGEPEPEDERDLPASEAEPISVFAPVPVTPPSPPVAAEPSPPPPPVPAVPRFNAPPPVPEPSRFTAAPPETAGGRSGLAELNVRQPVAEAQTEESSVVDQLTGLEAVEDDLLPSRRGRK
jgi:hypothetical protein